MKKIISLVLCLALGSFALAGCAGGGEPLEEKSYTPDAQVSGIDLEVRDRAIQVSPSPDGQVHIQYFENSTEFYQISVSDDHVLTMTGASGKGWTDYLGGKPAAQYRVISLQVPDALLDSLALSTTNEDITLSALAVAGRVSLSSNGGNLSFAGLDVGAGLDLKVKNGDISGTVAGSAGDFTIQAQVKKGESNLPEQQAGGAKALTVSANNGDVEIGFVDGTSSS